MSLLELKDVTVSFPFPHGRPPLLALDGLTLSVEQGELVALVGPPAAGKPQPSMSWPAKSAPPAARSAWRGNR